MGAVVVGVDVPQYLRNLHTQVPLCAGAPATPAEGGGFAYGPQTRFNGWWRISAPTPLPPQIATVVEQSRGLLRQNLGLFQCFYGVEEPETLCRAPQLAGVEIIRTSGGHHFDGDYRALAHKIVDGAARRLRAAAPRVGPCSDCTSYTPESAPRE
jgi:virulence protein VirJ